jgi:hypothetical protein
MGEGSVRTRIEGLLLPVTFVRPYDEATRERVLSGLRAAGADLAKVFRDPVDVDAVRAYLLGAGRRDRLCIPYFARGGTTGLELLAALHDVGTERRIVMPVKIASPTLVRQQIERALGTAADRVLVLSVDDIEGTAERSAITAHLRGGRDA